MNDTLPLAHIWLISRVTRPADYLGLVNAYTAAGAVACAVSALQRAGQHFIETKDLIADLAE